MRKHVFGHIRTAKSSACATTQSDEGLSCPLTKSLDTTECMNGQQRLELEHARDESEFVHFAHAFKFDVAQFLVSNIII